MFKRKFIALCISILMILVIGISAFSYAAEPLLPANGANLKTLTPDLAWTSETGATKYDIWLLKKSKTLFGMYLLVGRSVRDTASTTMKIKDGMLQDGGDYMWMVRSVTPKSTFGNFGRSAKFSIRIKDTTQATTQPVTTQNQGTSSDLNTVTGLINAIRAQFGIIMENGTAQWALNTLKTVYNAFAKLPSSFFGRTQTVQRISTTPLGSGVMGYVNTGAPGKIYITDLGAQLDLAGTLVHEMTHCFQFNGNISTMNTWSQQFWGARNSYSGQAQYATAPPTEYGKTNAYEDMAESVRVYFASSASLKQRDPARYEFVKTRIMNGKEF